MAGRGRRGRGAAGGGAVGPASHGESIYNWLQEFESQAGRRARRYRSKHSSKAPLVGSTFGAQKKSVGSFGRSVKGDIQPKRFLRAGEKTTRGVDPASKPGKFQRKMAVRRKPGVPKRTEQPLHGIRSNKNYVVANAVENILAAPGARPAERPDWTQRPDYGKVPEYLQRVKEEVAEEREAINATLDAAEMMDQAGRPVPRPMPEDEREELLAALKAKWDEVNRRYQRIAHQNISTATSTIGQIRIKETCEKQMAQLEKDIERLSAKGPIYIMDD